MSEKPVHLMDFFGNIIYDSIVYLFERKGSIGLISLYCFVFYIVYAYIMLFKNKEEIQKNWPKYKCRPHIIPIAGLFYGKSFLEGTKQNLSECSWSLSQGYFGVLINPFKHIIEVIVQIIGDLIHMINQMRKMVRLLRELFGKTVEEVFKKIANGMATLQFYIEKFRNIIKKQYAVFYLVYYYLETLRMSFSSFINGPTPILLLFVMLFGVLTVFLMSMCIICPIFPLSFFACPICVFCFHPNTLVKISDTEQIPIKQVKLEQMIYPEQKVLGKIHFWFDNPVEVFNVNNSWATESHLYYLSTKVPIRVSEIRNLESMKTKDLMCLVTSKNLIYSNDNTFSDYNEIVNDEIDNGWNERVLKSLNKDKEPLIKKYRNYPPGFLVKHTFDDQRGNIEHCINELGVILYDYKGIICSGNNIVLEDGLWIRVSTSKLASIYNGKHNNILYDSVTKSGIEEICSIRFRDFMETDDLEVYDWFHKTSQEMLEKKQQ